MTHLCLPTAEQHSVKECSSSQPYSPSVLKFLWVLTRNGSNYFICLTRENKRKLKLCLTGEYFSHILEEIARGFGEWWGQLSPGSCHQEACAALSITAGLNQLSQRQCLLELHLKANTCRPLGTDNENKCLSQISGNSQFSAVKSKLWHLYSQ